MAETNRKSKSAIKFNSGNAFYVKYSTGDWENLGNLESGELVPDTGTVEANFADGNSIERGGATKMSLNVVLSQSGQAILDRAILLNKKVVKVYYYNGDDGGTYDEFYFPEATFINKGKVSMSGNNQQKLDSIELKIIPQDAVVSSTPSTDWPTVKKNTTATPVASTHEWFLRTETVIT